GARHASFPFYTGEKGGFFATDKGSGAFPYADVKRKRGAKNMSTQVVSLLQLGDGRAEAVNGQGIFRPDINIAFIAADGIGGNNHPLQHAVGVAFQKTPVHKSTGVAFIG